MANSIDIKDKIVSKQTHGTQDITCGGSLNNPTHKLSKKIEKSIFNNVSIATPTEKDRDFIYRDENDNVMVVDKTTTESVLEWKKITSMDDFVSGEEYLIVEEIGGKAFNGSLPTLDVEGNTINVEVHTDGDTIPYTEDNANSYFIISEIDGGYSVKSQSGYFIGRTTNSNGIETNTTTPFVNSIGFSNGFVVITSSGNPVLQKNSSSNRFRFFKSIQMYVCLYKKVEKPGEEIYTWKTLVSNDDIDVITEEELEDILQPKCNEGNLKEECCDPETNNIIPCEN